MASEQAPQTPRPFDTQTLKVLVHLMSRHDLSEIDLIDGERRIRLRRGAKPVATVVAPAPVAVPAPSPAMPAPARADAPIAAPEPARPADAIKSPTPGTFYARPNPDAPPFVGVGTRVTPTTVVCIIEAMKIFNEIQAERSGTITKVLVESGQPVEYDQPLFEIDPT